jgi:hypothetical protein
MKLRTHLNQRGRLKSSNLNNMNFTDLELWQYILLAVLLIIFLIMALDFLPILWELFIGGACLVGIYFIVKK